jgi:transposase
MDHDSATALLGVAGLQVAWVEDGPDQDRLVHVTTADGAARVCPGCQAVATRPKEGVSSQVRDLLLGGITITLIWSKRRWYCPSPTCERVTFTEWLPQLPPRCRLSSRLRAQLATAVADQGRTVAEAADTHQVSWHTTHEAFAAHTDTALAGEVEPVVVLGIDETRRGKPKWVQDPDTGTRGAPGGSGAYRLRRHHR